MTTDLFHRRATRKMRDAALAAGLTVNDRVFGFADSGAMDRIAIDAFLRGLPNGVTELYGHPATRQWEDHPMPADYKIIEEYRALIRERTRQDYRLASYTILKYI
jgi:hypothetical protein